MTEALTVIDVNSGKCVTKKKKEDMEVEVAMQYTGSYSELVLSYANNINTTEGGMHLAGFRSSLTRACNDYAKKNKILKEIVFI